MKYKFSSHNFSPKSLLRLLHRVAFVSSVLILGLSASGIYWVYEGHIIADAEGDAVSISESIVELEKHLLLHPSEAGGSQLVVNNAELNELDLILKKVLKPYNILKMKIFSLSGQVVYSTDRSIIGQNSTNNHRLDMALSGINDSKLQTKEEAYDLSDEKRFNVDVVETYVPIRNELNEIVGSFEIYQDITPHRKKIIHGVLLSVAILAGILIVIFAISYLFLKTAVAQLSAVQDELRQLATKDGLTGLLNHREIVRLGKKEFSRHVRQTDNNVRAPFSLIMADLDNFKQINDQHSHLDGDEVLRVVADRINKQMRNYSIVGRYGGEEFLVVLPEANAGDARAVAERIRKTIEARSVNCSECEINATLSLGVATVNAEDETFDEVLLRADKALYLAKGNGRNQVGYTD